MSLPKDIRKKKRTVYTLSTSIKKETSKRKMLEVLIRWHIIEVMILILMILIVTEARITQFIEIGN